MLDIIERFIQDCKYSYLRMDGRTSVSLRQPLVAKFNEVGRAEMFYIINIWLATSLPPCF